MEKTVLFKIYILNENNITSEDKTYEFNLNEKIIDIKKKILKTTFNDTFNFLDLENITERVYKDYGKLFFDKGLLPPTIDNYKLSEFTTENRTFSFLASAKTVEILRNDRPRFTQNKKSNNEFIYNENDFPPL